MKTETLTIPAASSADDVGESAPDTKTVLDNVVELDRMLDEGSRRELDALPVLELSKHMRVRATKPDDPV